MLDSRDPESWKPEPWGASVNRRLGLLEGEVTGLKSWQTEMRTVWRVVQIMLGTSLVGVILGVANLLKG